MHRKSNDDVMIGFGNGDALVVELVARLFFFIGNGLGHRAW
jgi:hypothetical protein